MNKRIEELALKSGLINYVDNETPRRYFIDGYADLEEVEKFAESVIRECVSLFDGSEEMKTVGFLSHKQIVEKIEEHFRS